MPAPVVLPRPPALESRFIVPLLAQEASYFAASARIESFVARSMSLSHYERRGVSQSNHTQLRFFPAFRLRGAALLFCRVHIVHEAGVAASRPPGGGFRPGLALRGEFGVA